MKIYLNDECKAPTRGAVADNFPITPDDASAAADVVAVEIGRNAAAAACSKMEGGEGT